MELIPRLEASLVRMDVTGSITAIVTRLKLSKSNACLKTNFEHVNEIEDILLQWRRIVPL